MSNQPNSTTNTSMKTKNQPLSDRISLILDALSVEYTGKFEGLDYVNPLELLIATILSAQSTDKLVNKVTPALFKKYRVAQDYANVDVAELEVDIHSTGFYRAKAKNIKACCTMLVEKFNSRIPSTMDELLLLPGVGRKTANCILCQCFGMQTITVDTHVSRIANLLGLVDSTNADKIEFALMEIVPENRWNEFNEMIITHGRKCCVARRPQCQRCAIADLCPSRQYEQGHKALSRLREL